MDIGSEWAYRTNQRKPVTRVKVLRVGANRPLRVLVRFMADEYEGREEWVPPARLKTTWDKAEVWVANDKQWTALRDASWRPYEDPELRAAEMVLDNRAALTCIETGYNKDTGILYIKDMEALARLLPVADELTPDPLWIADSNGTWAAPFATMLLVAKHVARVYADEILAEVAQAEAEARLEAVHGRYYPRRRGEGEYISPEICREVDQRYIPAWNLVRDWCGQDAVDRLNELEALRQEVFRLGKLMERSITALRRWDANAADSLEKELGIPVETLRRSRSSASK